MVTAAQSIRQIARENGIELVRPSPDGSVVRVSDRSLRTMLKALGVEVPDVRPADAPPCFLPQMLLDQPAWGISLQLYELRSARNWGIGDFADLWAVCDMLGERGVDFIGLNPLHAGFLADPARCSPYEPSNRRFLNPLYIAVDEVGGFERSSALDQGLDELRTSSLVEYEKVAQLKIEALRNVLARTRSAPNPAFSAFVEAGSADLHRHAVFETVSRQMAEEGYGAGWRSWPPAYRSPESDDVARIERTHADDIEFHKWLQWVAHVQLEEAKERCRQSGMRIGLFLDLAVGEAFDGSATWSDGHLYVSGAAVGNPPEPFAADGQDWRLAAFRPDTITEGEPSPYGRLMAASMRYAGAIRIDHAAAFARLFLVPTDGTPADGAYVSYPTEEMLRDLSDMSRQHDCLVIGEDLGNVAGGLREDLTEANVLSYRILSYEKTESGFVAPDAYPQLALACVSTHDHQTFHGWWNERDIDMRLEHGLVSAETTQVHRKEREEDKQSLIDALRAADIIDDGFMQASAAEGNLMLASYAFIASTPCLLVSVRLADLTDEKQPTNIPGTDKTYPNWRPKLSLDVSELRTLPMLDRVSALMRDYRPRQ